MENTTAIPPAARQQSQHHGPAVIPDSIPSYYLKAANLNNLATEILLPIMKRVGDLHSLWALVTASKRLYQVLNNYATEVVDFVMEHGSTPAQTVNIMRAMVEIRFWRTSRTTPIYIDYYANEVAAMPLFSKFPVPVPKVGLRKLLCEAYHIHNLAHLCLQRSLSKCQSMLGRLNDQVRPAIPGPVAAELPSSTWFCQEFAWSQQAEDVAILSIWRLNYFYALKMEVQECSPNQSTSPESPFHGLPVDAHFKFDYVSTFFHSHVREQVMNVIHLLDELEGLDRLRPPTDLGPSACDTSARGWLDSLPSIVTDNIENCYGYEWSRKLGPFRLPSTRKIMGTDDPSWGSRCAILGQPPATQPARENKLSLGSETYTIGSIPTVGCLELGGSDTWGLPGKRLGPDFRPMSSEYRNMAPVAPEDPEESPAWTFFQNVIRPSLSSFGNLRLEKMPALAFRDLGVHLFDGHLLTQLGLWPVGGLVQEHLYPDPQAVVNEVDKYSWLWVKLLHNQKLAEISMDEHVWFLETTQSRRGKGPQLLVPNPHRPETDRARKEREELWRLWKRRGERWRRDRTVLPYESWAHYDW